MTATQPVLYRDLAPEKLGAVHYACSLWNNEKFGFGTIFLHGTFDDRNRNGSSTMPKYKKDYDLFAYADQNRPSIVYMATNLINGKRYIGITRCGLRRRQGQHIAAAKRGACRYSIFHKAIRKYGEDVFVFETLLECESYRAAGKEEIRLIAEMKPEYNLGLGGEGVSNVGMRINEKARAALRAAATGRIGYWTGKKRPDIAEKQRRRLTGRADLMRHMHVKAHTRESWDKAKATKRARGGWSPLHYEAMKRRRKPVVCLTDGRTFACPMDAAKEIGCTYATMIRVLTGVRKSVYRLRFAYAETLEVAA